MASIFKYRRRKDGKPYGEVRWRCQIVIAAGRRTRDFAKKQEAVEWARDVEAATDIEKAPRLGGATKVTLAELLTEYAKAHTIAKGGRDSELNRINHYLPANQPALKARQDEARHWTLMTADRPAIDIAVPDGWQDYLRRRRTASARTYELIAKLGARRVSTLLPGDMRDLMTTMKADGLSDSTIQKEIALLRHACNVAGTEWGWVGFDNPCAGLKLGKSTPRFINVSQESLVALYRACRECDNPLVLLLVDCAIFLTARSGSLLELRWEDIDFENRNVWLRKTKTGPVLVRLPLRTAEVLGCLERHASGRVFPMTKNAVVMAWRGVREKAGLPQLQFRDLRHLGGTHYAKLVPNAHVLREVLGHRTLHQAQVYVNLASTDVAQFMDAAGTEPPTMPPMPRPDGRPVGERKAARLNGEPAPATMPLLASVRPPEGNVIPFPRRDCSPRYKRSV